ncbi:MAG TPA: cytochrome b [Allosphingosinicella sp.]|nr:cytochrome b [Allosphingosinicella sp.]
MATLAAPDLARYSRVAVWLHWLIATLIVVNLLLGFFRGEFDKPVRAAMMDVHKATGLTILLLSLARLGWRLGHRPPPFDPVMKAWEAAVARLVHWLFYLLMIALPLTGWMIVSTNGRSTSWFGLFDVAALPVAQGEEIHEFFEEVHEWLAYGILVLLALHVGGALRHHLAGHRHLVGRMAPWLRERDSGP